ncbi:hypothetical protein J6590_051508 [Homalodisca vitripennis]|nr:hypothetical protein J6590_051508 [Homalodisca vitripennis]
MSAIVRPFRSRTVSLLSSYKEFKIMESRGRLMVLSALQQVNRNGDEEPAAKRSKIKMQSLRDEEENRQGNCSIEELRKEMVLKEKAKAQKAIHLNSPKQLLFKK